MPVGQREIGEIRREDVEVSEDGKAEPVFSDDAVAELVWRNYQNSKTYLEQNSWLLDWQAVDYYYQNQNNDRWMRPADGRPVRIARYIIAKNANTMDNQVHRGIWSNQKPFALQPEGATTELMLEASAPPQGRPAACQSGRPICGFPPDPVRNRTAKELCQP